MMRAIAIDDEPPALKVIEKFCSQVPSVDLQGSFTRPGEALRHLQKSPADLLFLDIRMPSVSGIDFYKSLEQNILVIFTTAYSEYAVEGFNVNAVDYLLKPYTFDRFQQAVNKARDQYRLLNGDDGAPGYLMIRADYSLTRINTADILFIEGLDDYLKIHLSGRKPLITRMTMKAMQEKLPEPAFIRVHRSYIVPFRKIETVRNKTILIAGTDIPIGSSYEEAFYKHMKT
jgi:DNA-binding LytR/AlgR family response regulator